MATPTATFKPALTRSAFDNLLRRELNVSNPNDPEQVAQALLKRYGTDPRARSLRNEVLGLATTAALPAADGGAYGGGTLIVPATMRDLSIAQADLEQDFSALLASPLTKDIRPELEGWQGAIEDLMQQGLRAARLSVDLLNRDRMFASRRRLSEYARLSRLVGALTPELEAQYRNLAFSIDEVRAVMFVLAGEALADADQSGDGFMVKVGRPELELRREAVLSSLRALTGVLDDERDVNATPVGLMAYAEMVDGLERLGYGELRVLANESDMAALLDSVLDDVDGADASRSARRLGATSWGPLRTLERFSNTINGFSYTQSGGSPAVAPNPAPIDALVQSLSLFMSAFGQAGGGRLKAAARPAILQGTMSGSATDQFGINRLLTMIALRSQLQHWADEQLVPKSVHKVKVKAPAPLQDRVLIDACLYFADCAIDLHASSGALYSASELRAVSYAVLIDGCADASTQLPADLRTLAKELVSAPAGMPELALRSSGAAYGYPVPPWPRATGAPNALVQKDIKAVVGADQSWRPIVQTMASRDQMLDEVFNTYLHLTEGNPGRVTTAYDRAYWTLA